MSGETVRAELNLADSNVNIVPKIQYEPNSASIKVSQISSLD